MNTKEHNYYESAGLKLGSELGGNFVLMQDSMVVKDLSVFDLMLDTDRPVSFAKDFFMYFGKFVNLEDYPLCKNKQEAVTGELGWCRRYATQTGALVLFPEFTDTNIFEDKYGKKRMVLENKYIKKWKNCWDLPMIEGADKVQ
jgi:hypothetical protein